MDARTENSSPNLKTLMSVKVIKFFANAPFCSFDHVELPETTGANGANNSRRLVFWKLWKLHHKSRDFLNIEPQVQTGCCRNHCYQMQAVQTVKQGANRVQAFCVLKSFCTDVAASSETLQV